MQKQSQTVSHKQSMDGWMDGWIDGWMDGWLAGWLAGWMAGWLAGWLAGRIGKGQMGSALMGSLRISCFLTEGLFGYSC